MSGGHRLFEVAARLRGFRFAFRGLALVLRSQHNAWIHATATLLVCLLGWALGVGRVEWAVLVLAIASVWGAEAMNTAFELLCDAASPDPDPRVEKAKDVAAGAVLATALGAAVVALLIFVPRILSWLNS